MRVLAIVWSDIGTDDLVYVYCYCAQLLWIIIKTYETFISLCALSAIADDDDVYSPRETMTVVSHSLYKCEMRAHVTLEVYCSRSSMTMFIICSTLLTVEPVIKIIFIDSIKWNEQSNAIQLKFFVWKQLHFRTSSIHKLNLKLIPNWLANINIIKWKLI